MKKFFKNWKTTLLGLATIVINIVASKGRIDPTIASGIIAGAGLVLACDSTAKKPVKPLEDGTK